MRPSQTLPRGLAKRIALLALAAFFVFAGVNHFVNPDFYVRIMPPYLPAHLELVYLSGVFEVLGGVGVLVPGLRASAGWGLVLLLLAVYPANLHMALHPELFPEISAAALYARLPLQIVFVAWAYWATRPDGSPTTSPTLEGLTEESMRVVGIEHVQLAMPAGEERRAREFYSGLLGIPEIPKPPHLAARGGAWFENAALKIHLGVDEDFRPARKAHPALLVEGLAELVNSLRERGYAVVDDEPLEGFFRVYVADPFGNRIELMEPSG